MYKVIWSEWENCMLVPGDGTWDAKYENFHTKKAAIEYAKKLTESKEFVEKLIGTIEVIQIIERFN